MTSIDNSQVSKHLGQISEYKSQYDPTLLVKELRQNNREHLGIDPGNLPFVGFDTWNAYEVTCLTKYGVPVNGVAKIVYDCNTEHIVESKSLKLYFNSFNMTQIGDTPAQALSFIEATVAKDLRDLFQSDRVKVRVVDANDIDVTAQVPLFDFDRFKDPGERRFGEAWVTLEKEWVPTTESSAFDIYNETPEILQLDHNKPNGGLLKAHSATLFSRCRVTQQPDHGDVYIYMQGDSLPTKESLLEYIASFRNECHFHEEICETIYIRLMRLFNPKLLCVTCLYARRGGIDINPARANVEAILPNRLQWVDTVHCKTAKQ